MRTPSPPLRSPPSIAASKLALAGAELRIQHPGVGHEGPAHGANRRAREREFRSSKTTSGVRALRHFSCLPKGAAKGLSVNLDVLNHHQRMERVLLVRICCVNPSLPQPLAGVGVYQVGASICRLPRRDTDLICRPIWGAGELHDIPPCIPGRSSNWRIGLDLSNPRFDVCV